MIRWIKSNKSRSIDTKWDVSKSKRHESNSEEYYKTFSTPTVLEEQSVVEKVKQIRLLIITMLITTLLTILMNILEQTVLKESIQCDSLIIV